MQRGLGGSAFEPVEQRRDREVTLGPAMLIGLVAGLLLLCGVCFLAGYSVGHRASPETQAAATQPVPTPTVAPAASNQPKPSASQGSAQPPANAAGAASAADTASIEGSQPGGSDSAAAPGQPSVQAVLPAQGSGTQPVSAAGQAVQPALAQAGAWMVQIAAVSNPDDANVLVSALRRHGYNVSVRHDPADNLMHVQVGPFASHNDAAGMRQKLLNDGYNALVQP
jgi:cell division septation protein DedD